MGVDLFKNYCKISSHFEGFSIPQNFILPTSSQKLQVLEISFQFLLLSSKHFQLTQDLYHSEFLGLPFSLHCKRWTSYCTIIKYCAILKRFWRVYDSFVIFFKGNKAQAFKREKMYIPTGVPVWIFQFHLAFTSASLQNTTYSESVTVLFQHTPFLQ